MIKLLKQVLILFILLDNLCYAQRGIPKPGAAGGIAHECEQAPKGKEGARGDTGAPGIKGEKGEAGKPASSIYLPPHNTTCTCILGPPGDDGHMGAPGDYGPPGTQGAQGYPGYKGQRGPQGEPGLPGAPATTLSPHPPTKPGKLYVPLVIKGRIPQVICHHFRRKAYVPGIPNNWLGWYESGKSGFFTYHKWLYYSSRFACPCSVQVPPHPIETIKDILKRL